MATAVGSRQPRPRPVGLLTSGSGAAVPSALSQNFLYQCVGTALGAASSKDVVRKQLRELLATAGPQEEAEREVTATLPRPCA